MRRFLEHKSVVVVLGLAGLLGLGALTAVLDEARFQPAGPSPFDFGTGEAALGAPIVWQLPFPDLLLYAFLVLALLGGLIALLNPQTRKQVLRTLLRFALVFLLLGWALQNVQPGQTEAELPPELGAPALGETLAFSAPPPEFVEPQVNSYLVYWISFIVALGLMALIGGLLARRPKPQKDTRGEVAGIARRALAGLQEGRDWNDAILLAYLRMSEVLSAERGLTRQPGVTPSEFAVRMEQMGLPGEAARTLTRLFEQVRYGGQASTGQDRDLAVAALNAILQACGAQAADSRLSYSHTNWKGSV